MIGPALPSGWKPPPQESAAADSCEGLPCKKGILKQAAKVPLPAVHLSWEGGQGPTVGCGLRNLGNSCYLNSVLQCLTYVPPLGRRCLERQHSSSCPRRASGNMDCAACLLEIRLARNLEMGPAATEGPVRLWKNLHLLSKELRRGSQEDAHEALRVMAEAWNRDTLRGIRGWNHKPPRGEKEPTTPISQLFGGEVQSQVRCLGCGHESNTTEAIMDLSLDVNGCRTLLQALKRFTAAESLDGDNKYRCDKCRRLVAARKQMTVRRAPHCLVVHLKRFDFMGGKLKHPVAFGETLSMAPFMSSLRDDNEDEDLPPEFHLSGVVVHQGSTRNHGHYHALIRDGTGTWYDMDDSCVTRATRASVLAQPAYLLFYSRRPPTTDGPVNGNHNGSSALNAPNGTPAATTTTPPVPGNKRKTTFIGPSMHSAAKGSTAISSSPDTETLPAAAPSKSLKASTASRTTLIAPAPPCPSPREAAVALSARGPDSSSSAKPPQRAAAKQSIWMTSAEVKNPRPGGSRIRTAVASGASNKAAANGGPFNRGPSSWSLADHQGSGVSAAQPAEEANGALSKRRKVDGGDLAARQATDRERVKAMVRSWCLQGPLASTYAAAREVPADSPEFGKLRARAEKAASTNPEALLGTEKYRQALGEVDSLLP